MRGREDADVAGALIDGGADLEAPDGSIGTPLDNAVGYACWHVARLLVARGAKVEEVKRICSNVGHAFCSGCDGYSTECLNYKSL